jgi:hypothetical protein
LWGYLHENLSSSVSVGRPQDAPFIS